MVKNAFSFNNDDKLKLDIAGEVFYVDSSDVQMLKEIDIFTKKATDLAVKGQNEGIEALEEVLDYCAGFVDAILGEGATKKIFKDRRISLFDLLNLIEYLAESISEDRMKRLKSYTKKF